METVTERNRQIVEDVKAAMKAGPSPYADVIRKRQEQVDDPGGPTVHDLDWLLGVWGPYFPKDVTNAEVFQRLDEFGLAIWQLESPSERSFARGTWIDWLKTNLLGVSEPWRMVDDAIKAGQRRHEVEKLAATNGAPHWFTPAELAALEPPSPLIGDLLPLNTFGVLFGAYGAGKTFIALDMELSVATNTSFHGEPVAQGGTAYILAEGRGGIAQRVQAWSDAHGLPEDAPFRVLPVPVHLTAPETVETVIASIRQWCAAPKLVVIDTLFRCFSGNEHSPEDMNAFIAGVDRIRQELDTAALVLHHPGHDQSRGRGHSSLAQAADVVMKLERNADSGLLTLSCEKARDNAPFVRKHFRLTRRGPSLVPELAESALSPSAESALATLHSVAAWNGASHGDWYKATGQANGTFNNALKTLREVDYVKQATDHQYHLTQAGYAVLGVDS